MATSKDNNALDQITLPDAHLVRKSSLIFRALNHKLRQKILELLAERKKMTVTEMYEQLLLEQSVVSQHLAILRRTGFVCTKKEGKFVWYMLQEKRILEVKETLKILMS